MSLYYYPYQLHHIRPRLYNHHQQLRFTLREQLTHEDKNRTFLALRGSTDLGEIGEAVGLGQRPHAEAAVCSQPLPERRGHAGDERRDLQVGRGRE